MSVIAVMDIPLRGNLPLLSLPSARLKLSNFQPTIHQ